MEKSAGLTLKAIATSRKSEIERLLDGIQGNNPKLWTNAMRPSMRKDDPPEDE